MLYIRREVLVRVGSLMRVLSPRVFPTPGELTITRTCMQVK
jgi:hypothetical protein